MLKIEVIKFEAMDVITASTAAPVERKCICPTDDSAVCSSSEHFGPNGEVCPGEVVTYESGRTGINHNCPVN